MKGEVRFEWALKAQWELLDEDRQTAQKTSSVTRGTDVGHRV